MATTSGRIARVVFQRPPRLTSTLRTGRANPRPWTHGARHECTGGAFATSNDFATISTLPPRIVSRPSSSAAVPHSPSSPPSSITLGKYANPSRYRTGHPSNNVPPHIAALVGRDLHLRADHPIGIVRSKIQEYFSSLPQDYTVYDAEDPIVTTTQCFDDLLISPDHPGRSPGDTYYIDDKTLLRTHTSAHQSQHLRSGAEAFLCAGDVYRRDDVDATHYPAFHQLEGVRLFPPGEMVGAEGLVGEDWISSPECKSVEEDLKDVIEGLMDHLFGAGTEKRWAADHFPFTEPSFELEIHHEGEWLEVLGCGVVHEKVLELSNRTGRRGWAFGLGLERLAMILFKIPDIRLFWTEDERFHSQFREGKIAEFRPYSKFPPVFKDMTFWTTAGKESDGTYVENDFFDMVRGVAGDLAENVNVIDDFTHPKTGRNSRCYRITYRSMDRSLKNEEIDDLQFRIRDGVPSLGCELR